MPDVGTKKVLGGDKIARVKGRDTRNDFLCLMHLCGVSSKSMWIDRGEQEGSKGDE